MLSDQVPELYRFVVPVFPSEDDDVITSPYNSYAAVPFTCFISAFLSRVDVNFSV